MSRTQPPRTRAELNAEGPNLRLGDLARLAGVSKSMVEQDRRDGVLFATRRPRFPNSPYYVTREEARRWYDTMFPVEPNARSA